MTGSLPDYVLTDPLPDVPAWCCTPPARGSGPLILSGSAIGSGGMPARAGGTVVIGGSAVAAGYPPARGAGPLVLGGGASGAGYPPARGAGPLVLGGGASGAGYPPARGAGPLVLGGGASGAGYPPARGAGPLVLSGAAVASMASGPPPSYASPSGATAETQGCDQCPDGAAVVYAFDAGAVGDAGASGCSVLGGRQTVTYIGSGCAWAGPQVMTSAGADQWVLAINSSLVTLTTTGSGIGYSVARSGWDCLTPITLARTASGLDCVPTAPTITISPS